MSKNAVLVDPLAALFRPQLAGIAPLVLDSTEVEVELLPPLARVTITRRFTNASDQLLEAVLTLPPPAPHEVVYGLTVTIDGADYHAQAQDRKRAQDGHDSAINEGRRAILYELVEDDVQLISIAGIEARAEVVVRIESIRPLDRPDNATATLCIALSADPRQINLRLLDSDSLLTTPIRHHATLSVVAGDLAVELLDPNRTIESGKSVAIDCARPLNLRVVPIGDRSLDRTDFHVGDPGGWQASLDVHMTHSFDPLSLEREVISNRTDWIFGRALIRNGDVRVIAPSPMPHASRLQPNARAMAAFAAASVVGAAARYKPDVLRLAANILTRRANLVFIGQEGELPDDIPTLRKLALPIHPGPHIAPGARAPTYRWLTWSTVTLSALAALWTIGAIQFVRIPLWPVFLAWAVLMLLIALRFFPREGSPARRRMPLLLLLALPWIASIACSSLGLAEGADAPRQSMLILFQEGLLLSSVVLPFILLPFMRDARRFTLTVGLLNLMITFLATSEIIIGPGS